MYFFLTIFYYLNFIHEAKTSKIIGERGYEMKQQNNIIGNFRQNIMDNQVGKMIKDKVYSLKNEVYTPTSGFTNKTTVSADNTVNIILPSIDSMYSSIISSNEILKERVNSSFLSLKTTLKGIINKHGVEEKQIIENVIATANTELEDKIILALDDASNTMRLRTADQNTTVLADVPPILQKKNTTLPPILIGIVDASRPTISSIIQNCETEIINNLTSLITAGNNSIYDQVKILIKKPSNKPHVILKKIKYPKGDDIANSLNPIKDDLFNKIKTVLLALIPELKDAVTQEINNEINDLTTYITDADSLFINDLKQIINDILPQATLFINEYINYATTEIIALLEGKRDIIIKEILSAIDSFLVDLENIVINSKSAEIETLTQLAAERNKVILNMLLKQDS
ncbi:hypothetical protein SLOPH_934 [Spraguea lophii 42_110]|uniref:Uncharacterized protein n=1 Tax=Spraguea lophii (strain 42_110) TaxID=1358809 RepID=S7W801_SPRLO|nr:hypothetical protein SLOPH_934 [Spraguea lophii 42_110]